MDVRTRRRVGGVVWLLGLAVAMVWSSLDQAGIDARGMGFAPPVDVAPIETARVQELPVELHELVDAQDVVVRMDASTLRDEREVVSANLLAVQDAQVNETANDARRFAEGVQDVLVDRARLATRLQEDIALLDTLRERLSIEEDLATTGASSTQAVEEWKRQIRVVEARIAAGREALSVVNEATDSAIARNEDAPRGGGWSVVVATRQLETIDARIERMDLRAGVGGQVTWIYRTEGEVVPAGEPVVQVRRTGTSDVLAFVSPSEVARLESGSHARVVRASGQQITGELVSVGAGPQQLPASLWHNPSYPEYGVPVRVRIEGEITPDETVSVRL